jgi:hypothetical protein
MKSKYTIHFKFDTCNPILIPSEFNYLVSELLYYMTILTGADKLVADDLLDYNTADKSFRAMLKSKNRLLNAFCTSYQLGSLRKHKWYIINQDNEAIIRWEL